jgi:hypothetical protein
MKRLKLFITAMAALLLCACGSKAGNTVGQDSAAVAAPGPDYVTKTDYDCGSDEDFGISAEIKGCKVFVSVDADKFVKTYAGQGMDYRLNESTYEVQNLDTPIVSLHLSDIGQDYNPVLCMLRQDGRVQILDVFDAISRRGFFQASWPLPELKDIVSFKKQSYEEHLGIAAISSNGSETEVPLNTVSQTEFVHNESDGSKVILHFTCDWKFVCQHFITGPDFGVKEIKEYVGEYTAKPIDGSFDRQQIAYTIHTFSSVLADNATPKPFTDKGTFIFEYKDNIGQQIAVTPQSGKILPLPKGHPVRFDQDAQ